MIEHLMSGEATVSALAAPHAMTLSGAFKHVRVLENAGLIRSEKRGRTVWCSLDPKPLHQVASWVSHYESFWDAQLYSLSHHLGKTAKERK